MVLLDTCTLLWLAGGVQDQLSATAVETMKKHPDLLCVSAISALEIGLKARRGKLTLQTDPEAWYRQAMTQHGLHEVPVHGSVAAASTVLPPIHKDPCDRIIVATAMRYDYTVLTPDECIRQYPDVKFSW